jgi:tRNA-splicing ligase RtcB
VNWASILDDQTRRQAERTATLPFIHPHVALMPDAHLGKGATVGSVLPTRGAIIPAAVGVDIGCGMIAVRTPWSVDEVRSRGSLAPLRGDIERAVPLSAGKYNKKLTDGALRRVAELEEKADELGEKVLHSVTTTAPNWTMQLGSLGSGNHFIEVTADEQQRVWLFLHSGSRGVGNKIAQKHIAIARQRAERENLDLPDRDLAWLEEGTPEFDRYIAELRWAQHFALLNREEMMDRVADCLATHMRADETPELERINCHHNFTQHERHFDEDLWVSRKGAIQAKKGQAGLIPGSMGTASYVVSGRGNPESLESSPHGAGRAFSRTKARKTFTRAQLDTAMAGIEWRHSDAFLDEIPAAYKPIDQVMEDAKDLVEVRHTLRQLVNVKGD